MRNKIKPDAPVVTSANEDEIDLPRGLLEAVDLFEADEELRAMLGGFLRRRPTRRSSAPSSRPSWR